MAVTNTASVRSIPHDRFAEDARAQVCDHIQPRLRKWSPDGGLGRLYVEMKVLAVNTCSILVSDRRNNHCPSGYVFRDLAVVG